MNTFQEVNKNLIYERPSHQEWLTKVQPPQPETVQDDDDRIILGKPRDDDNLPTDEKLKIKTEWETFSRMLKNKKDKTRNALFFWGKNQPTLPILAEIARKWLCIPASSASSGQVFRCGGNIVTAKRIKLKLQTGSFVLKIHLIINQQLQVRLQVSHSPVQRMMMSWELSSYLPHHHQQMQLQLNRQQQVQLKIWMVLELDQDQLPNWLGFTPIFVEVQKHFTLLPFI